MKIRRIGRNGFNANGRPVELGEIVAIDAYTAAGLVKMAKAEYV